MGIPVAAVARSIPTRDQPIETAMSQPRTADVRWTYGRRRFGRDRAKRYPQYLYKRNYNARK